MFVDEVVRLKAGEVDVFFEGRQHVRDFRLTIVANHNGSLAFSGDSIIEFGEKVSAEEAWINGGFFVFEPAVFDLIDGDEVALERETMERLTAMGELAGFRHTGFWQPMDTLREKHQLQELWDSGDAPWKRGR